MAAAHSASIGLLLASHIPGHLGSGLGEDEVASSEGMRGGDSRAHGQGSSVWFTNTLLPPTAAQEAEQRSHLAAERAAARMEAKGGSGKGGRVGGPAAGNDGFWEEAAGIRSHDAQGGWAPSPCTHRYCYLFSVIDVYLVFVCQCLSTRAIWQGQPALWSQWTVLQQAQ
jgi:hypothetical protein